MKQLFLTLAIALFGYSSYAQFSSSSGNTTTSDNVGVGTTTPPRKFTVSNNGAEGLEIGPGNLVGDAANAVTSVYYNRSNGTFINNVQAAASHSFGINGAAPSMIINSSGNVGIGTTSPVSQLDVAGSINLKNGYNLTWGGTYGPGIPTIASATNAGILFYPYGSSSGASMTINTSGNVGIGTTSPSSPLHVQSSANSSWATQIINNGTTDAHGLYVNIGSSSTGIPFRVDVNSSDMLQVSNNGNVLIGKSSQTNSAYKLDINGSARANEVVVNTTGADFVFNPTYNLPKLSEVKSYIDANHHLPEITSAEQMKKDGMSVGEMNIKLLQKVEELTLYLIDQQKQMEQLKQKEDARIVTLETALAKLTANKTN